MVAGFGNILPSIKFFLWKCWLNCLPVCMNLTHRGLTLVLAAIFVLPLMNLSCMSSEIARWLETFCWKVVSLEAYQISLVLICTDSFWKTARLDLSILVAPSSGRCSLCMVSSSFGFRETKGFSKTLDPIPPYFLKFTTEPWSSASLFLPSYLGEQIASSGSNGRNLIWIGTSLIQMVHPLVILANLEEVESLETILESGLGVLPDL